MINTDDLAIKRKAQVEKLRLAREKAQRERDERWTALLERVNSQYAKEITDTTLALIDQAEATAEAGRSSFHIQVAVKGNKKLASLFPRVVRDTNPLVQKWKDIMIMVRHNLTSAGYWMQTGVTGQVHLNVNTLSGHDDLSSGEGSDLVVYWVIHINPGDEHVEK